MIESPKLGDVQNYGKSVEDLFRADTFPKNGATLLDVKRDYFTPSSSTRGGIHEGYEKGEWLADVVETDGAKGLSKGRIRVVYVQRPEDIRLSLRKGKYASEGGKRIPYDCPPDGWVVPGDGKLYHPKTGAAIATMSDKAKAVRENVRYMDKHPEQFAGWTIPARWKKEFNDIFKEDVDLANPTHAQLAEFITSYQFAPVKNSGLRAVGRSFWSRGCGPFRVVLCGALRLGYPFLGARLRVGE
jgi:hypothetical protein